MAYSFIAPGFMRRLTPKSDEEGRAVLSLSVVFVFQMKVQFDTARMYHALTFSRGKDPIWQILYKTR